MYKCNKLNDDYVESIHFVFFHFIFLSKLISFCIQVLRRNEDSPLFAQSRTEYLFFSLPKSTVNSYPINASIIAMTIIRMYLHLYDLICFLRIIL